MSIRRCIFDQHEVFHEIETDNPAVDLEVAAVNAGRNDGKIDYELGLGGGGLFSMCRCAALRLIASAARVAFFMAWFPNSALVICNDRWQKIRRDWLDMQGTAPLVLAVGLLVLRESSRDQRFAATCPKNLDDGQPSVCSNLISDRERNAAKLL